MTEEITCCKGNGEDRLGYDLVRQSRISILHCVKHPHPTNIVDVPTRGPSMSPWLETRQSVYWAAPSWFVSQFAWHLGGRFGYSRKRQHIAQEAET